MPTLYAKELPALGTWVSFESCSCRHLVVRSGLSVMLSLALLVAGGTASAQTPLGPNFPASTPEAAATEVAPAISLSRQGELVAVWQRHFFNSPTDADLLGRRFGSDGQPLGPVFDVLASSEFFFVDRLAVSHSFTGGFLVSWCEPHFQIVRLRGQRFDTAGERVGTPFTIVPKLCDATLSHSPQGGYRATWVKDGVFIVQRFSGSKAQGPPTTVDPTPGTDPRISHAPDGSFVIVWQAGLDALMGRRFDADGVALGTAFRVDGDAPPPTPPFGPPTPQRPRISHAPDGKFAVAIERSRGGGFDFDTYFRVFDSDGMPLTAELHATTTFGGTGNVDPEIAFDSVDGLVVIWGSSTGVSARRFAPSGVPLSAEFNVSSDPPPLLALGSRIAAQKGVFTVAWNNDGTTRILARRFSTPSKVPSSSRMGALALLACVAATALRALRNTRRVRLHQPGK